MMFAFLGVILLPVAGDICEPSPIKSDYEVEMSNT